VIGRPMEILLVEDDLEDAGMTIETLRGGQVPCRVSLVRNGEEALSFLRHEAHFAQTPRPDLILLDLQLPKKDGRSVLAEVRADPALRRIPVVVLTSTQAHWELLKQEHLFVESFLLKPIDREQFSTVVKSLRKFMLSDVVLP
jgi:CheY-like chemotaxis protein